MPLSELPQGRRLGPGFPLFFPCAIPILFTTVLFAVTPNPLLSDGKQSIVDNELVAINVGNGYSRLLWYWSAIGKPFISTTADPADYQIQTSSSSTNGIDGAWSTVISVTGNRYNSRVHTFDFTGKTWVRMFNADGLVVPKKIEIHDASKGCEDTWFFMGNSITAAAYDRTVQPDFASNIHARFPSYYPVMLCGGVGGEFATNGASRIDAYLTDFPDMKYWAIEYGTNDSYEANLNGIEQFRSTMQIIIDKIMAAGKIPILARMPFSPAPGYSAIPLFNSVVDSLALGSNLIHGPDLYTYIQSHASELADGVHPNSAGAVSLNRLWAEAMDTVPNLYSETGVVISNATATPSIFAGDTTTIVTFGADIYPGNGYAISNVSIDLSPLGGGPAVAMDHETGNRYVYGFSIVNTPSIGVKKITLKASDTRNNRDSTFFTVKVIAPGERTETITDLYTDSATYPGFAVNWGNAVEVSGGAYEGVKCIDKTFTIASWWDGFAFAFDYGAGVIDMSDKDSLRFAYKGPDSLLQIGVGLKAQGDSASYSDYTFSYSSVWREVGIPLKFYADQGIDVHRIRNILINISGKSGSGHLFIDDIKLTKSSAGSGINRRNGRFKNAGGRATAPFVVSGKKISITPERNTSLCVYTLAGDLVAKIRADCRVKTSWTAPAPAVYLVKLPSTSQASLITVR
jgi:lysophospholipase L1-like esterase